MPQRAIHFATAIALSLCIVCACAGCTETIQGFRGTITGPSGNTYDGGEILASGADERALKDGRRFIILDTPQPDPLLLVLAVPCESSGEIEFTAEPDAPCKAWVVDQRMIMGPAWLPIYCTAFADMTDEQRSQLHGVARMTGVVRLRGRSIATEPYDVRVRLKSKSGITIDGRYAHYVELHPERPFYAIQGYLYWLFTGKLPI